MMPPGKQPDGNEWQETYTQFHLCLETGRAVYEPEGWQASPKGKEGEIARLLTDNGYDVVLWRYVDGDKIKNPDAYLISEGVTEIWEFERLTPEAENPIGAVKSRLRDGKKQAANVLLYIDRDDVELSEVRRGIRTAIFNDNAFELRQIGVLFRDGRLIIHWREDW